MTDPELADRTYIEPVTAGVRRADHRPREAGRHPADDGRADRAQRRDGALGERRARASRRRADRRDRPRDRDRRRPKAVWRGDGADRLAVAQGGIATNFDEALEILETTGYSGDHSPVIHARRHGRRHRLQSRGVRAGRPPRPRSVADDADPHRAQPHRLEGVRARGDARPRRQRRHRLLDRESRPDGRAHRRLRSPSRRR